jgi:hypothetical protein
MSWLPMSRCIRTLLFRRHSLPVLEFLMPRNCYISTVPLHLTTPLTVSTHPSPHTLSPHRLNFRKPQPRIQFQVGSKRLFCYRRHCQAQIFSPVLASGTGKQKISLQSNLQAASRPDPADESAWCPILRECLDKLLSKRYRTSKALSRTPRLNKRLCQHLYKIDM